ncbi:MAG: hypothetical protein ABJP45_04190 [Cyclobacteriaceae bacterium]
MIRKLPFLLALVFVFSCSDSKKKSEEMLQEKSKEEIIQVYANFEKAVKDKDVSLLQSTFLSKETQLNAYIRTPDGLRKNIFPLEVWTDFLGQMTDPYHIEISNIEIVSNGSIAYSIADFKEFYFGDSIAIGKDLFTYVRTPSGWKIVSLSNTATVLPKDSVSLADFPAGDQKLAEDKINLFFGAVNERDTAKIRSMLLNPTPFLSLSFSGEKDIDPDSLYSFLKFSEELDQLYGKVNIEKVELRIIDRNMLIAEVETNIDDKFNRRDKLFLVTLFTEEDGQWLVTSLLSEN